MVHGRRACDCAQRFDLYRCPSHLQRRLYLSDSLSSIAQEQAQQQTQLKLLLDDVAVLQNDRDVLAEETGVSQNISGVEMHNKIVQLESECDHFQEVTARLDRYIEEMLRTMLGTLDQGRLDCFCAKLMPLLCSECAMCCCLL